MNAVLNHLLQSTLFAGLAALLAFLFRKNFARIRYWLWVAASLKFLVPFSLLLALGSHLGWIPLRRVIHTMTVTVTEKCTLKQIDTENNMNHENHSRPHGGGNRHRRPSR